MFSTTWIELNANKVDQNNTFSCTGQASNEGDNFTPEDIFTTRVTSTKYVRVETKKQLFLPCFVRHLPTLLVPDPRLAKIPVETWALVFRQGKGLFFQKIVLSNTGV